MEVIENQRIKQISLCFFTQGEMRMCLYVN